MMLMFRRDLLVWNVLATNWESGIFIGNGLLSHAVKLKEHRKSDRENFYGSPSIEHPTSKPLHK
jgi:hypothetical protein